MEYKMKNKGIIIWLAAINVAIILFIFLQRWPDVFYDFHVFLNGSNDKLLGLNPYRPKDLSFVYHPLILDFNLFLERFELLRTFFLLCIFGSSASLFFVYRKYLSSHHLIHRDTTILLLSLTSFGFIFGEVLVKMNVSFILNNIILTFVFLDLSFQSSNKKATLFGIGSVFVFSIIKPYLLAYLLYYLITNRRLTLTTIIPGLPIFFILLFPLSKFLYENDYNLFINAIDRQTINRSDGLLDVGFSYFGFLSRATSIEYALIGHVLVVLFLFVLLLRSMNWEYETILSNNHVCLFMIMLVIVTSNPRMMVYDFFYLYLIIPLVWRLVNKNILLISVLLSLLLTVGKYFNYTWAGPLQKIVWWVPVIIVIFSVIGRPIKSGRNLE